MRRILILVAAMLAACSSTGIVPMDSGTYIISKRHPQAGFGPPTKIKGEAYQEANDFCAKDQKTVETIDLKKRIPVLLGLPPFRYIFAAFKWKVVEWCSVFLAV